MDRVTIEWWIIRGNRSDLSIGFHLVLRFKIRFQNCLSRRGTFCTAVDTSSDDARSPAI